MSSDNGAIRLRAIWGKKRSSKTDSQKIEKEKQEKAAAVKSGMRKRITSDSILKLSKLITVT